MAEQPPLTPVSSLTTRFDFSLDSPAGRAFSPTARRLDAAFGSPTPLPVWTMSPDKENEPRSGCFKRVPRKLKPPPLDVDRVAKPLYERNGPKSSAGPQRLLFAETGEPSEDMPIVPSGLGVSTPERAWPMSAPGRTFAALGSPTPTLKRPCPFEGDRPDGRNKLRRPNTELNIKTPCSLAKSMGSLPACLPEIPSERKYLLPTICVGREYPVVTPDTLRRVMAGEFAKTIPQVVVVDCRFPYEYEGGHIDGAINLHTQAQLETHFMTRPMINPMPVVIFHCEFSSKRAPEMYKHLRSIDRTLHLQCYPALYYPEMYVMQGGYQAFFTLFRGLCEPQEYVKMIVQDYAEDRKDRMRDLRETWKRSRSWSDVSRIASPVNTPSTVMSDFGEDDEKLDDEVAEAIAEQDD